MDINKERDAFELEMANSKSIVGCLSAFYDPDTNQYQFPEFQIAWHAWQAAKSQATPEGFVLVKKPQKYFSHDFNGDGFKYHDTLKDAEKEAEANLDYYRDRVADGHHVGDDGEFNELCYGIVVKSADYCIDDVVTKEHHEKDEYTQYEIGTEILSLNLHEEIIEAQEQSHD